MFARSHSLVSPQVTRNTESPRLAKIASLTDEDGNLRQTATGSFGYYHFEGVPAGQTVIVDITAKRFTFAVPTRVVETGSNVSGVDFFANEEF